MSTTEHSRVAVVTGGSRGIGRQVAARLAAGGHDIALAYASQAAEAQAAVAEVEQAGGRAIAVQADVAEPEQVARLFDAAEQAFGGVDVLVNAAGIMRLAPLADLDLDDLDAVLRTNVRGTVATNQQAVRRLRPGGSIVNLSTSVIGLALPTYGAYVASKGAVEALTRVVANELRGRDITVNAVAPGPVATSFFLEGKSQELIDRMAAQPPLERLGTPEDIAEVVAFLVSPAGHWVHGQVLRANGGLV